MLLSEIPKIRDGVPLLTENDIPDSAEEDLKIEEYDILFLNGQHALLPMGENFLLWCNKHYHISVVVEHCES